MYREQAAGGEHPGPGGQLRWHVDDRLAVSDQALRDMTADPVQPSTAQVRSLNLRPAASIAL